MSDYFDRDEREALLSRRPIHLPNEPATYTEREHYSVHEEIERLRKGIAELHEIGLELRDRLDPVLEADDGDGEVAMVRDSLERGHAPSLIEELVAAQAATAASAAVLRGVGRRLCL